MNWMKNAGEGKSASFPVQNNDNVHNPCFVGPGYFQISGTKAPISQTHIIKTKLPTRQVTAKFTQNSPALETRREECGETVRVEPSGWNLTPGHINHAKLWKLCPLVRPRCIENCQLDYITRGYNFCTTPKNSCNLADKLSRHFATAKPLPKWNVTKNFCKHPRYQISRKSAQWKPTSFMRTDVTTLTGKKRRNMGLRLPNFSFMPLGSLYI